MSIEPTSSNTNCPMVTITDTDGTSASEVQECKVTEPSAVDLPCLRRQSNDSDVNTLVLSPQPTQATLVANFLLPPTRQATRTSPPSMSADTPIEPLNTPYGLQPTEHDTHHAPHPLNGPRHTSRCGIARNRDFAQHCLKYGPWLIDRPADPHTTVKIGHGSGVAFRHFEAEFLDFPGVKAIKIVHPLCAIQLRSLDWDVMRSVAVHLRQYVGTRAVATSTRNKTVLQAEKASLAIVEREIESRNWERKRAADELGDSDGSDAASESSRDDFLSTSLSYNDLPALGETSGPVATATALQRTRRPEFNTRRSYRGRVPVSEADPASKDEQPESKPVASHADADPQSPDTDACPAYDAHGENMGQDQGTEQDARIAGPSRSRSRVEDFPDETLGVNYGCTGRGRWF